VKPCLDCHREDMKPSVAFEKPKDLRWAPAYLTAFHKLCVPCHQREAVEKQQPQLAECNHCHPHPRGLRQVTRVADAMGSSGS
jgi:hypothetical protein